MIREEAGKDYHEQREHDKLVAADVAQPLRDEINEKGTNERAHAADHGHTDHEAGLADRSKVRGNEFGEVSVKGTRKPAGRGRERKGHGLPEHHIDAAARRRYLIISDRLQEQPRPRAKE